MSVFTFTALRELAPGTVLLASVTREFRLLSTRLQRKPQARRNTSLSGEIESILLRSEKHYNCQTELIAPGSLLDEYLVEFLASVENSEVFIFDRFGTIAQPDQPVSCFLVSKATGEQEVGKKFIRYGFVIRETG
jgi:hypothetical protein